jgi:hypothetical protein
MITNPHLQYEREAWGIQDGASIWKYVYEFGSMFINFHLSGNYSIVGYGSQ